MNVTLTPELERLIDEKVTSGQYSSPDAVVQAALELFREQQAAEDRIEALLDEADNEGEGVELTAEVRSDLESCAVAGLRANHPSERHGS